MSATHGHPRSARRRRHHGLALALVMLALAVCVALGSIFLATAGTAAQQARGQDRRLKARMIAESGLAAALAYVERDPAWRTARPNGQWVASQAFGGGTFTVRGEDGDQLTPEGVVVGDGSLSDDAQDPVTITSVGTYGDARHIVRAVRRPALIAGLGVTERVEVLGRAAVDSYDSAAGPYSAATASTDALATSNGAARRTYVVLRDNARVNGNVYYGVGGVQARALQKGASAVVTGSVGPLPAAVAASAVAEPAWPANPTGVVHNSSSGIAVLSSDLWCDRMSLHGTAALRVVGDRKLYVSGDLTLAGDARIELGNPVAYGATVSGPISIYSNYPVDSYDSSLGPYGGTNVGSNAVLATNSILPGAITVSGKVKGDVYSGVGSIPATSILVTGSVTGTRGALAKPVTLPSPPPWPTGMPASVGNFQVKDVNHTLASDLQTGTFEVTGNGVLKVVGHRVVRVNGDFKLNGNGAIDIPDDGSLTTYVGGTIDVNGNGVVANTAKSPPRFLLYGMTAGRAHSLTGNADLYAIIDAPGSSLSMSGNAVLYGAVMASSLDIGGNAIIHADRNPAVADANPRLAVSYTPGSKLTVYTNSGVALRQRAQLNANTANPALVTVTHLGPRPLDVSGDATAFATALAPRASVSVGGAARWTGRIDARDLVVGGTATVNADATGGAARPAVVVTETVEVRDNAVVTGLGGFATLASRGATEATVDVADAATFRGDAFTAPDGVPSQEIRVAPTATFAGDKRALEVPVEIAAWPAPPVVGPVVDRVLTGSNSTVLSGDVYCQSFEARDDAVVEVAGETRLILTGNFKFSNRARLALRDGARLTVHCPGDVVVLADARLNVDGRPEWLVINCYSGGPPRIEFGSTVKVSATVLAPDTELRVKDAAEFFGAFRGRRVTAEGDAKVHCINARPPPLTWVEQR